MYKSVWRNCHASVCCINFINDSGIKTITASGFKVGNFIITDDFSYKDHEFASVQIFFVGADGACITARVEMSFAEYTHRILNAAIDDPQGFLVIRADFDEFAGIPSLRLSQGSIREIGDHIAVLGFRFDQNNLSIMPGIMSSIFHQNSHQYLEVDATVRQGFSGGPVIHPVTMEVLGIIGFRLATMHRAYNRMMKIINDNLRSLKEVEGKFTIQDIDPIQVLMANQNQIKHIATQIFRSTDIRTGIAHDINHLVSFLHEMQLEKKMAE
jgi:hypothetical protein